MTAEELQAKINYIESIRIQILDEFMERIKFESGNVNVTLMQYKCNVNGM